MLVCSEKLSFGSKVTPRILGWRLVGIWILLMVRVGETFSSEVSGVKCVDEHLSGLSFNWFMSAQFEMESR